MPVSAMRHKKTVSVTIEPALLHQAALKHQIRESEAERWKRANRKAIQELNRITDEHGLLSDDHRTF